MHVIPAAGICKNARLKVTGQHSLLGGIWGPLLCIEVGDFVLFVVGEGSEEFGGGLLQDSFGFRSGGVSSLFLLDGGDEPGGEILSISELREDDLFKLGEIGGGWGRLRGHHVDDLGLGLVGEFLRLRFDLGLRVMGWLWLLWNEAGRSRFFASFETISPGVIGLVRGLELGDMGHGVLLRDARDVVLGAAQFLAQLLHERLERGKF